MAGRFGVMSAAPCTIARMSANPPKFDRWPPYRDIRFVLVDSPARLKPCRGLVIGWQRAERLWEARVVYWDENAGEPGPRLAWIPVDELVPVPVDPNLGRAERGRR